MTQQVEKLSIYITKPKRGFNLIERLQRIGEKDERSMNYLVVEAIREYVEKREVGRGDQ